MLTEDNMVAVRSFYEEVINKKNVASLEEFINPNCVDHALPPGMPAGIEGSKQFIGMYLTAFPDLHFTVEDMIAEGDKVVARLTTQGTQTGPFLGIPPTGKHTTIGCIDINRMAGGKSVEHWLEMDTLGLLQQLGVIPESTPQPTGPMQDLSDAQLEAITGGASDDGIRNVINSFGYEFPGNVAPPNAS
jgi:predicted ester cyclase